MDFTYTELLDFFIGRLKFIYIAFGKIVYNFAHILPLTIYQCWVLFRIHQFLKLIPKAELLKHSLEHDSRVQQQYSKAQFEATYPEIKEEHPNNGIEAICRIA